MKNKILLALVLLFLVLAMVSCAPVLQFPEASVTSIAVSGLYNTDDYFAGDSLDVNLVSLVVSYSDGKIATIPLTLDMLVDYDMRIPEENKVITVRYGGATTKFTVNVHSLEFSYIDLSANPYKTRYIEGENIDPTGAVLSIHYEGGKTVRVDVKRDMLESYDNTRLGEQDIYVSYFGYRLSFKVNFEAKVVTAMGILAEPAQSAVFKGMGSRLSLDGMRLRLTYDNGLAPEAIATDILDNLKVYVDDTERGTTLARIAYLPADYPTSFTYLYGIGAGAEGNQGSSLVRVGDFVQPDTELASNSLLDSTRSRSYGVVTSVAAGQLTVSTVVTYNVTVPYVEVGEIILSDAILGTYGSGNVSASGGSGVVTAVSDGVVAVQTAPVASFSINVQDRSFKSIEVITTPVSRDNRNPIDSIIQGDTLDLTTGRVRVTFDNGETEEFSMLSPEIKVINSDDDQRRSEIENLTFLQVDDQTGLNAGRYELRYIVSHIYPDDAVKVVVTVVDENGKDKYIQDNRYVSLDLATNYVVSITATYLDNGIEKVSEYSYRLATVGAKTKHSALDISAAGRHTLLVYYGDLKENNTTMTVNVIQRYAVKLIIDNTTNNVLNREFYKGSTIPITSLRYMIEYNNGDSGELTGVTYNMVGPDCNLVCDTLGPKIIYFIIPGTDIVSDPIPLTVVPVPIEKIKFDKNPINAFLTAPGAQGDQTGQGSNQVNLAGAVLRIYYADGKTVIIGDGVSGRTLPELLTSTAVTNHDGEYINVEYNPSDTAFLSKEDVYILLLSYKATLTYFDEDGASCSMEFDYYIVRDNDIPASIRVQPREGYYKSTYIQSEDWDLTGISIYVTYKDGASESIPAEEYMIYDSDTNTVGRNIPVKFRYFGVVDDTTLKITVEHRLESRLSVGENGKNFYVLGEELDVSAFKFLVGYNGDVPSSVISGITEFSVVGGMTSLPNGWWCIIYSTDANGNKTTALGTKYLVTTGIKIVRFGHTTVVYRDDGEYYNTVYTEFEIEVIERDASTISRIAYEDLSQGSYEGVPILSVTAKSWDLFLYEYVAERQIFEPKYITVYYTDGTSGRVLLTREMVHYDFRDLTLGFRRATITYKGRYTTQVYIQVLDATISGIAVEKAPGVNFIVGSELSLAGGILRIIYTVKLTGGGVDYLYKYIDMEDEDVKGSDFNNDISPDVDSEDQVITLTYRRIYTTSYTITIFNKQQLSFLYHNTIFFYGNTAEAVATPIQTIEEFDPFEQGNSSIINMYYGELSDFIAESDIQDYLQANHKDISDFMEIIMENRAHFFVEFSKLVMTHYIEPAATEYYIIMQVIGNTYYRTENYALQKYTVIPRVIEVKTVESTLNAFVRYYSAPIDGAAAIKYLYLNLADIIADYITPNMVSGDPIQLLSPSVEGFEIAVFVTSEYSNVPDDVASAFSRIESVLMRDMGYAISPHDIRIGINRGVYNGIAPERVSYRIEWGELRTRNDVLELLEGRLQLANYNYSTGTFKTSVGTLHHKNYNIDFYAGDFVVLPREINSLEDMVISVSGGTVSKSVNGTEITVTVSPGARMTVMVTCSDGTVYTFAEDEIAYYTVGGELLEGMPTTVGTYKVKVAGSGAFSIGGASVSLDFTLVIA